MSEMAELGSKGDERLSGETGDRSKPRDLTSWEMIESIVMLQS